MRNGRRVSLVAAAVLLALLSLGILDAGYWILFYYWRSAAEPRFDARWWSEARMWMTYAGLMAVAWIAVGAWLLRLWGTES